MALPPVLAALVVLQDPWVVDFVVHLAVQAPQVVVMAHPALLVIQAPRERLAPPALALVLAPVFLALVLAFYKIVLLALHGLSLGAHKFCRQASSSW